MIRLILSSVLLFNISISWSPVNAATIVSPLDKIIEESGPDDLIGVIAVLEDKVDNVLLNQRLKTDKATLAERHYIVVSSLMNKAVQTQGPILELLDQLESQGKIERIRPFWISNLIAFKGTKEAILSVARLEQIEKILFDMPVESVKPIISDKTLPMITSRSQGLDVINAPQVWAMGYTGAGRIVSNIDTGVDGAHPALSARWRGNNGHPQAECWFDPIDGNSTPHDHGQHGTHTMGTICGRSSTTYDTIGVAIEAQWIGCASIDPGSTSDVIASFQFIADPDGNPNTTDDVPDAVGNSWGWSPFFHGVPHCDNTFWAVMDGCENAGVAVIFSAGNEGSYGANSLRTPADRATTYFNAFSVGAIDGHNPSYPIAGFSSLGPCDCASGDMAIKPECVAPGVNVYSSIPGGGYAGNWSGTSMASPHVTGSIAILRQVNPNLDVDTIRDILLQTSVDLGPAGEENTYGHGVIDLYQAVLLAMSGSGYVDGYVTDASNSNPLAATVEVVGDARSADANSSGYYFLSLNADTTFTLRATHFGYLPQEYSVYIIPDDTVSQDFQLTPAPSAVLQGTVTSIGGGFVGGAEVAIMGTPLTPDTTDSQGFYHFPSVPSGSTYQVRVKAIGFSQGLDSVYIQDGVTNELNFQLYSAESFENSNGGYSGSGVWQWGVPTSGPSGAWSGVKLWGTVLNGIYPNNADDPLYSIDYQISDPTASLEFYHWFSIESNYDGGNVSISTNGGGSWTLINPIGGYPYGSLPGLDDLPGYSGESGWTLAQFDLSSYYGQTVRFKWRFGSDAFVVSYGWYIDDVVVIGTIPPEPPDIAVNPELFNVSAQPGDITTRDLTINNNGNGPLVYSIQPETTDSRLIFDNGREIAARISLREPTPIGYHPADQSKPGSDREPFYPPVIAGSGGPDNYGHSWIDSDEPGGPSYNWVDITGVGTQITGLSDDTNVGPYYLGFNFDFYGQTFNSINFCTNGFLSFTSTSTLYSNTAIPSSSEPFNLIAPMWDDLNFTSSGTAYFYTNNTDSSVISWINVPHFGTGGPYTFQAILLANGRIFFQYQLINTPDNSATAGIQNSDGTDGLQIVHNAGYLHNNLAVKIDAGIWLSVNSGGGIIAPNSFAACVVTFDASDLASGVYNGSIIIDSNDPDTPHIVIPVVFSVGEAGTPQIFQTPSSITETLITGNSVVDTLKVKNTGTAILTVSFSETIPWLDIGTGPFDIPQGDSLLTEVFINAAGLPGGSYTGSIVTNTNDPVTPVITTPVTLNVLAPVINPAQSSIAQSLQEGAQTTFDLVIRNTGTADLSLTLDAIETALISKGNDQNHPSPIAGLKGISAETILSRAKDDGSIPSPLNIWLFISPAEDLIVPGDSLIALVTLNASTLTPGEYSGQIDLLSNDPVDPSVIIPVALTVTEIGGGGDCIYAIGDVNNSGNFNGLDITYSVAFFKGGPGPLYQCECTPADIWYVSGDVNGSCSFNGLDVTYGVSYLKGGSGLIPCPDCPPAGILAIPAKDNVEKSTE